MSGFESIVEVSYLFEVSESLGVQPDFQWILDPHDSRRDAYVIGLRILASADR